MKIKPIQFILTAIILLAIDAVYLKFIGGPFYSHAVKKIQGKEITPRPYSVVIVYIIIITGLYYFIIGPNKSYKDGAFFGLAVYGVFDFTNHAILDNYSLPLAMMDTIWGMVLCGFTTFIMTKIF
jgi:uncharacterized membrane protein